MLRVTGLDHLVLAVRDVEVSLAWYRDVLGLAGERVEQWRRGEAPFPSVRIDAATIIDFVPLGTGVAPAGDGPGRNCDHLCLVVDADLDALGRSGMFRCVGAVAQRFGAQGVGASLYVLDPDDFVVELRTY